MPAGETTIRDCSGFTLLELLVVIGVISVLMGIGVGYLGRSDPMAIATSMLQAEKRAAQLTARAEGVATEVWLRPGQDGVEGAKVQARLLDALATFHFEPNESAYDERLRGTPGGTDVVAGRFGHARRAGEGDRAPLLTWSMPPRLASVRDGFVLRLDLWLDAAAAGTVAEAQPLLELQLDASARPTARLRLVGVGEQTVRVRVTSERGLPVRRWCTLEVGCDGKEAWLAIDGRECGRSPAEGWPQQPADEPLAFVVSPLSDPLRGMVDEVRWQAFVYSPPQFLPPSLQPKRSYRWAYDARGDLVEDPVVEYVTAEDA